MRVSLKLDDEQVADAQEMTGLLELKPLLNEALRALVDRERLRRQWRLENLSRAKSPTKRRPK